MQGQNFLSLEFNAKNTKQNSHKRHFARFCNMLYKFCNTFGAIFLFCTYPQNLIVVGNSFCGIYDNVMWDIPRPYKNAKVHGFFIAKLGLVT